MSNCARRKQGVRKEEGGVGRDDGEGKEGVGERKRGKETPFVSLNFS